MILSTKISTKFSNTNKQEKLNAFIKEYQNAVEFYINYTWDFYKIDKQNFKLPKYLQITGIYQSELSARALKCAATQALGIVKGQVKKLSKLQYIIKKKQKLNENTSKSQSKYDKLLNKLKKPNAKNIFPELNSICCKYIEKKTELFDGVFILSSLGKKYKKISIPVKLTRHSNELVKLGNLMPSFLISEKYINFRYKIEINKKEKGTIEGCDQGIKTCVTFSDGQVTQKCKDGHDLDSICKKLSKKKKGSKAFKRAQDHRTNYINWSVKQLNLVDIKQINIEKLRNLGYGRKKTRLLQAFSYKEIKTAMEKNCYLAGVQMQEQSNAYRSQRCSSCGLVHSSSRAGKLFTCKSCEFAIDADLNAARNHKVDLCELTRNVILPNKTTGFYWTPDGLFDINGSEFTVPVA